MDESESLNAVVFKTKVAHFGVKNTLLKDTNCKGKLKRRLSFGYEIVFRGIQQCFPYVGKQNVIHGSEVLEDFSGTFFILWSRKLQLQCPKFSPRTVL